jgi:hypothetical protein
MCPVRPVGSLRFDQLFANLGYISQQRRVRWSFLDCPLKRRSAHPLWATHWNQLRDRSPIDIHLYPFPGFDSSQDLGGAVAQVTR